MDGDLGGALRRMFAELDGARLDVPVRPEADQVIVAGARRLRRRRYVAVTVGAAAVAILVGSGIAIAVNGDWKSMPPAQTTTLETTDQEAETTTTSTTTRAATTTASGQPPAGRQRTEAEAPPPPVADPDEPTTGQPPPSLTDGVLTASGYGPFELGMSADDALATGLLRLEADGGNCVGYTINGGGSVLISAEHGITRIGLPARVSTPEGLGAGSTVGEVRAAYPGAEDYRGGVTAPASPGAIYDFVTVESPAIDEPAPDTFVVGDLRLASTTSDCALAM